MATKVEISKIIQRDPIFLGETIIIDLIGKGFDSDDPADYVFDFQYCEFDERGGCYRWRSDGGVTGTLLSRDDSTFISVSVEVIANVHPGCHRLTMKCKGTAAVIPVDKQWVKIAIPLSDDCPASACDGPNGCDHPHRRRRGEGDTKAGGDHAA